MKLRTLTLKNFMPYKGESRMEFPTEDFRNVMIVFGDNMRGKTSILNALRWGFYGRAVGRHSREISLHELPNKQATLEGDWTVEVRIEFEANGQVYDLRRNATKRSYVVTPQRAEDYLVQVQLTKNGIPVQGDLIEAEINQIAPAQVSRFFLFDGELLQEYETLLIEGSDQGRQIKEAIEQVLGVPALTNGRNEIGALLKSAQRTQQRELQQVRGLEQLAQRQAEMTEKQDAVERDLEGIQRQLDLIRKQRNDLDDELEGVEVVHFAKSRLDALSESQRRIEQFRVQKHKERLDILGQAWLDLFEFKVATRREQLEAEKDSAILTIRRRSQIDARIGALEHAIQTRICPSCNQALGDENREALGSELGQLQAEKDRVVHNEDAFQAVSAQLAVLKKIRGVNARVRISQIDTDIQRQEVELTKIENEMERLRDSIEGFDTAEIARKRKLRDEWVKEEGRLQNEIATKTSQLDQIKKDLAVGQRAIEGVSQARAQRSTVKATLCLQLETVFSESVERLRDVLRQTVERHSSEAFLEMTTQKAYQGLKINQSYGLSILDDRGDKVNLRSAGAEQVVALSLIDGLNRTGRVSGPVVMDTPFGRLDLDHRDNILAYLPKVTSQFILLVHSGEIRRDTDLKSIAGRIGATYEIREINPRHSVIERTKG